MANYLTMALDPNAANLFKMMSSQIVQYKNRMKELELELDQILKSKGISIVELFHRVAIR